MVTSIELHQKIAGLSQDSLRQIFPVAEHGEIAVKSIAEIGHGNWSTGHKVTVSVNESDSDFFLKLAKNGTADIGLLIAQRADFVRSTQPRDGIVETYGVYGLSGQEVSTLNLQFHSQALQTLDLLFSIQELLDPEEYAQVLGILGQLGLSTAQSSETTIDADTITLETIKDMYQKIIEKMVIIHTAKLGPALQARSSELYEGGIHHVIDDTTRLGGLGGLMPELSNGQISMQHVNLLKQKMRELAQQYMEHCEKRLRAVHGDLWAANIFADKQGDRVEIIDPASIGFGEAGLDVVFACADIAFLDANKSKGAYLSADHAVIADSFVSQYEEKTGDTEIRKFMALFYGYKAFVSALFDAEGNPVQREKLFFSAIGAVELALNDESFEFSFNDLDRYTQAGLGAK